MSRCHPALLASLLVAGALVAGCGDDDGAVGAAASDAETTTTAPVADGDATTTTATDGGGGSTTTSDAGGRSDLPPLEAYSIDDITELVEVYGPALAPLDLTITRGGLVIFQEGNHLQLYAEPTTPESENDPQVYLDRMLTSFQAIIPLLFDAYPDLDSFDLCQEAVPDPTTPPTEPGYEEPVTLLLLTRAGYESVDDWSAATLDDLLAVAGEELDDLGYAEVAPAVEALDAYQAARGD